VQAPPCENERSSGCGDSKRAGTVEVFVVGGPDKLMCPARPFSGVSSVGHVDVVRAFIGKLT
jgi:hypothetical protein